MKILTIFNVFACLFLVTGCLFQEREDVTPEQKARFIKNATRETIYLGIFESAEDEQERNEIATDIKTIIDRQILPILNNDEVRITESIHDQILNVLPARYRALLSVSYETLYLYYEVPEPGEQLDETQILYIRSFIEGVRSGACLVLGPERC